MTENFGDLKTLENKYNVSYQYDQYKRAYIIYLIQHGKRSGPVRIVDVHRMEREQALAKLEAATKDHVMKYDHRVGGCKDIRISKDRLDLIEDAFGCSLTLFEDKMQYQITLLADPNYKMTIDYDMIIKLCGPDEVYAVMANHCRSLVNKRNSDMKNYGEWQKLGDMMDSQMKILQSGVRKSAEYTFPDEPVIAMPAPKCTSCNDTGIVDSYMYGQYECTACDMTKAPKKEKELSAWDKKLKEELDRGDDTWGSITKKYKK